MDIHLFRSSGAFLLIMAAVGLPPAVLTPTAQAAFQRGFIYVGSTAIPGFQTTRGDRIFEVNPATGESRIFYEFPPESAVMNSLVFTPDGRYLRTTYGSDVLEIDGNGQARTAYTALELGGVASGANAMGYDRRGNFYASTGGAIYRFPADGGPRQLVAGSAQGVRGGAIAVDPEGNVYHNNREQILRFSADGVRTVIDPLIATGLRPTLALDDRGSLYTDMLGAAGEPIDGFFRYSLGHGPREFLYPRVGWISAAMAYSEVDESLYIGSGWVYRLNRDTGAYSFVSFPATDALDDIGRGIAVYVPEPSALIVLTVFGLLMVGRPRSTG